MKVLILKPQYKEKIWGGSFFRDAIDPSLAGNIGEMWIVSAHAAGDLRIAAGPCAGMRLSEFYSANPDFFNYPAGAAFPLLLKIIAPADDLSVQVHPDDLYAQARENDSGKTEGWLILRAGPEGRIVYGHKAADGEEFFRKAAKTGFEGLLERRRARRGDFYPIPAGTVHAAGRDIVFLEIQQSSDLTYRIYDYDRLDDKGSPRTLHLEKAREVIKNRAIQPKSDLFSSAETEVELWENNHFRAVLINVSGGYTFPKTSFAAAAAVIEGRVKIDGRPLAFGSGFILPARVSGIAAEGRGRIVLATPKFALNANKSSNLP